MSKFCTAFVKRRKINKKGPSLAHIFVKSLGPYKVAFTNKNSKKLFKTLDLKFKSNNLGLKSLLSFNLFSVRLLIRSQPVSPFSCSQIVGKSMGGQAIYLYPESS